MRSKRNRTDEGPAQPGRSADRGPLRVLLLITRAEPGGAQVHLLELCRGLLGRVELSVGVGQEGPDDNPFLVEALRSIGVTVEVLPDLRRAVAPRADRAALAALRALIRARRPHLVHTHSSKAGLLGRLAARLEGVPAVHTAHAWSFSDGLPWRQRGPAIPIEALAACWTRRFIVVSEADREIALRFGVARAEQVRVVHNGVPEVIPRARPSADGAPVIGMVARLAAPKDPLTLLRALAPLRVPYRLDLIGDGPERPAVVAEVQALGLGARVRMLGDRRDVPELLHDRLKDGYLSNPRVMARPESYLSKPVQVLGAVPKPGMYYLRGETTLLELLALAGGVNRSGVGELRVTHSDSAVAVSVVSYEALIGRGEGNLTVAGGDVVFVPESHVTVMGQVQKPGDVAFREDLTVSAAIAAAGGALGTANLGRVYILRGDQRIRVDVRKALAGKVEDPEVQAGDRIVVRQSVF